jgi:hypothetical protein
MRFSNCKVFVSQIRGSCHLPRIGPIRLRLDRVPPSQPYTTSPSSGIHVSSIYLRVETNLSAPQTSPRLLICMGIPKIRFPVHVSYGQRLQIHVKCAFFRPTRYHRTRLLSPCRSFRMQGGDWRFRAEIMSSRLSRPPPQGQGGQGGQSLTLVNRLNESRSPYVRIRYKI